MDNVKKKWNDFSEEFSESSDPLWFNSWLLWHRSACFASALMYFCLPCLSVSAQQQAKIHKSWPINKCHFLNAETPWECKQKVFPWMPFKLRAVCQLSRGRLIASAAAAMVVWCYLPRVFAFLLNFWWFEKQNKKQSRQKQTISILCIESVRITASTHGLKRENCLSQRFSARAFFHESGRIWKMMLTDGRSFHRKL